MKLEKGKKNTRLLTKMCNIVIVDFSNLEIDRIKERGSKRSPECTCEIKKGIR